MEIIIETKSFELTDSLRVLIDKKFAGFKKFNTLFAHDGAGQGKMLGEIFVEIEKESKHHRKGEVFHAEAMINVPGKKIFAKAHGDTIAKAIGAMRDELAREIRKYKAKKVELPRRKYRKVKKDQSQTEE